LPGAAGATVLAALAAATVSFSIGFYKLDLTLPVAHLARIAIATVAMAAVLHKMREATTFVALTLHIASGVAVYVVALVLLYAPSLLKLTRPTLQQPLP
jgi:hypothetical protein